MKKQIIILILLLTAITSRGQTFIKTTSPCNDALLQKTPGRLIKDKDLLYATTISKQQQQEILNRLDAIHQFVMKIYPSPVGVDAVWNRTTHDNNVFASQVKISYTTDGNARQNYVNGIAIIDYNYWIGFYRYHCGRVPNEILAGWPLEDAIHMHVYVNSLQNFFNHDQLDPALREIMCINGRPIITMPVVKGKWKGYTLYDTHSVLVYREGILPYIPVTRKEYLDRCIDYIPKFFDPNIKSLQSWDDKEQRDEFVKNYTKQKEDLLKHYQEELEKTTKEGLLDSPAMIPLYLFNVSSDPIFITEAAGGMMLVTENPAYFRKDLPKYIPQFFVLKWESGNWKPYQDIYNAIEQNFPIEKLQAMIDK